MLRILFGYILMPFAIGLYYIAVKLDELDKAIRTGGHWLACSLGAHHPIERGPHRQQCMHCHRHFDIDLMATNFEEHRIGFTESSVYLGAVGKVEELPWVHHLNEGEGNDLGRVLQVYDNLCAMYKRTSR